MQDNGLAGVKPTWQDGRGCRENMAGQVENALCDLGGTLGVTGSEIGGVFAGRRIVPVCLIFWVGRNVVGRAAATVRLVAKAYPTPCRQVDKG